MKLLIWTFKIKCNAITWRFMRKCVMKKGNFGGVIYKYMKRIVETMERNECPYPFKVIYIKNMYRIWIPLKIRFIIKKNLSFCTNYNLLLVFILFSILYLLMCIIKIYEDLVKIYEIYNNIFRWEFIYSYIIYACIS